MIGRFVEYILIGVGAVLLLAVAVPWVPLFHVPEPYGVEWVSAKLVMLPVGALCLGAAATLSSRLRRL